MGGELALDESSVRSLILLSDDALMQAFENSIISYQDVSTVVPYYVLDYLEKPEIVIKIDHSLGSLRVEMAINVHRKWNEARTDLPSHHSLEKWVNRNSLLSFALHVLPGHAGILVSTRTYVASALRGQGIAKRMQALKELIARGYGADALMATIQDSNEPQIHILRTHGWVQLNNFNSSYSGSNVSLWFKHLVPEQV